MGGRFTRANAALVVVGIEERRFGVGGHDRSSDTRIYSYHMSLGSTDG